MTETAVPILPSRDLHETLTFDERFGFENRGAPPDEWDYLIIGRGGGELHFFHAVQGRPGVGRLANGYLTGMKPKTMFYTALGFVTYKVGKVFAKRKAREVLQGSDAEKKN